MPSTFRWRCRPIHSRSRQNSPKSACTGSAGLARRLPVADRPVELLLLVPGDEGVAQQRGDVVGDRAAHRVLEVEDAGVRVGRPSGFAASSRDARRRRGCARAPPTSRSQASCQVAVSPRVQVDAALARDAPVGKERELAAQQRVVVRRQGRGRHLALPDDERGDRVAHQASARAQVAGRLRVPAARRGRARCRGRRAGGSRARRRPRARAARAARRAAISEATCDERPHVFLRRRRVHDDDAAAADAIGAEVAAKARVARRRAQRADDDAVARADTRQPGGERVGARRVGPGDDGGG